MVLCDPFAINVIGKSIIKVLQHLTTSEVLPRVRFFPVRYLGLVVRYEG